MCDQESYGDQSMSDEGSSSSPFISNGNLLLSEVRTIIMSALSGANYGAKVRLPHATVMTFLFRQNLPLQEKMKVIVRATLTHSANLASFAFIYKTILALLKIHRRRNLSQKYLPGMPAHPCESIIAGGIGGYAVWGQYNAINYQIALYIFSRVIVGLVLLIRENRTCLFPSSISRTSKVYPIFSSAVWATVMFLFEEYPHVLHPSLKRSMDEIYRTTNTT
mmetsp:Transcript_3540/g.5496  ORF Transcript_3540/g.5496 Transcript_3540/m.5496 type:complete len:221 (+) Transcript_3540:293-955(+)